MICPKCKHKMKNTMHFESDKQYQYNRCPYCYERTKSKRIHFDDLLNEENDTKQNNKGCI